MTTQTAKNKPDAATSGETNSGNLVVVDMGSHTSKRVKSLKKGRGKLMRKVDEVVADLQTDDLVPEDATVVVVIVKQKTGMADMFDLDDD